MANFDQRIAKFSSFLNWFAGTCLVGMMAIVCCDVVMRLFGSPILGVYEIVGFLGTATASLATAYTTVQRGHVSVSLIVMNLPKKAQFVVSLITHFLSIALFTFLTFECVRYGNESKASGELSLTLEWHLFPLLYGMAFSFLVVTVVLGVDFCNILRTREPWPESGQGAKRRLR
jgi:TRAP-type C4-dicarboxylate transport system permease small subunit